MTYETRPADDDKLSIEIGEVHDHLTLHYHADDVLVTPADGEARLTVSIGENIGVEADQ